MNFLSRLFKEKILYLERRSKKVFLDLMKLSSDNTLLDVGGNLGIDFEEIRKYFKNKKNFLILKSMRHSDLV